MNEYKYKIEIDRLIAVASLLKKHYGLGINYFLNEQDINRSYVEIEFPCSYEDFLKCFFEKSEYINSNGKLKVRKGCLPNISENERVIEAIWFIMSICSTDSWENKIPEEFGDYLKQVVPNYDSFQSEDDYQEFMIINYSDFLADFYEDKSRKDLLQLYLYSKNKIKIKDSPTQITIKYGKGKSVKLKNKDNWFEKVLLSNHFDKYLQDIESEENAKKALNVLNHPGKELPRPLMYHFIYGTYSMILEHNKKIEIESFCELLILLMEQMDYPTLYMHKGEEKEMDTSYVRKIISKLKKEARKYRFNIDVILDVETAKELLKKSGRFLYDKMSIRH